MAFALLLLPATRISAHPEIEAQIGALTSRLEKDPSDATLYLRRGELFRIHRDFAPADADYTRAVEIDPGLVRVDLCRGWMLFDQGNLDAALEPLDRFLGARPHDREGRVLRARILVRLGRHLEAAREWTRAIDGAGDGLRPAAPELYLERARALTATGDDRIDEALSGIDEGVRRLHGAIALQLYAIDLEVRRGRHDLALARLDRIEQPTTHSIVSLRPHATTPLPFPEGVASAIEPAFRPGAPAVHAEDARASPDLSMRRGRILEAAGRRPEARAAYARAFARIQGLPDGRRATRAIAALEREAREGIGRLGSEPGFRQAGRCGRDDTAGREGLCP